ncbi:MAG: hypothetical protein ABH822_02070 [Patescibacteria group bacterium]
MRSDILKWAFLVALAIVVGAVVFYLNNERMAKAEEAPPPPSEQVGEQKQIPQLQPVPEQPSVQQPMDTAVYTESHSSCGQCMCCTMRSCHQEKRDMKKALRKWYYSMKKSLRSMCRCRRHVSCCCAQCRVGCPRVDVRCESSCAPAPQQQRCYEPAPQRQRYCAPPTFQFRQQEGCGSYYGGYGGGYTYQPQTWGGGYISLPQPRYDYSIRLRQPPPRPVMPRPPGPGYRSPGQPRSHYHNTIIGRPPQPPSGPCGGAPCPTVR